MRFQLFVTNLPHCVWHPFLRMERTAARQPKIFFEFANGLRHLSECPVVTRLHIAKKTTKMAPVDPVGRSWERRPGRRRHVTRTPSHRHLPRRVSGANDCSYGRRRFTGSRLLLLLPLLSLVPLGGCTTGWPNSALRNGARTSGIWRVFDQVNRSKFGFQAEADSRPNVLTVWPRDGVAQGDPRGMRGHTIMEVKFGPNGRPARTYIFDRGNGTAESVPQGTAARWYIAHPGTYRFRLFAPRHNGDADPAGKVLGSIACVLPLIVTPFKTSGTDPHGMLKGASKGIWCNHRNFSQDGFTFDTEKDWQLPAQALVAPHRGCQCLDADEDSVSLQFDVMCSSFNPCKNGKVKLTAVLPESDVGYHWCFAGHTMSAFGICSPCAAGFYASRNGTVGVDGCEACALGKFSPKSGAKACVDCPRGYFSGAGESTCEMCAPGMFASLNRTLGCEPCATGRFLDPTDGSGQINAGNCAQCPEGYYAPDEAMSKCYICAAAKTRGTSLCNSAVGVCGVGRYQKDPGVCEDCAPGQFSDTEQQFNCTRCPAGFHGSSENNRAHTHEQRINCVACSSGRYMLADVLGAKSSSSCTGCSAGTFQENEGQIGESACLLCSRGRFSSTPAAKHASSCQPCKAGFWSSSTGATREQTCQGCFSGRYSTGIGAVSQASCLLCPAGYIQSASAQVYCLPCAGGRRQDQDGQISCISCNPGRYAERVATSDRSCKECPLGYHTPAAGLSACLTCPAGQFGDSVAGECSECEEGQFRQTVLRDDGRQNQEDLVRCLPCPAGYATVTSGERECERCQPGKYSSEKGSNICNSCSGDSWSNTAGATSCAKCESGKGSRGRGGKSCAVLPTDSTLVTPFDVSAKLANLSSPQGHQRLRVTWLYNHSGNVVANHTNENADAGPCTLLYFNLIFRVWEGGRCRMSTNTSAIRPGGCCDNPVGSVLVEKQVKVDNPRCSSPVSPPKYERIGHVNTDAVGVGVDRGHAYIMLPEPAWCRGVESAGVEAVFQNSKSRVAPLTWTTAADCQDTYLNRTILSEVETWRCASSCPQGASCSGVLAWVDVRPLFGYYRLRQGQSARGKAFPGREHESNNFTECRFPAACLGAPNKALKGLFDTCASDKDTTRQCDPSQVDSPEGCNEEAGFQRFCGSGRICRLCSRCRPGFQRSAQGVGFRCDQCPPRSQNKWRMIAGSVVAILFVLFLVKLGMADVLEGNPSDAMNRILLNFLQVVSIFVAFPLKWPTALLEIFKVSQVISVIGESLVNPDCELNYSPSQLFYAKMLVWAVVPILVVMICYLYWRCFSIAKAVHFTEEMTSMKKSEQSSETDGLELSSAVTAGSETRSAAASVDSIGAAVALSIMETRDKKAVNQKPKKRASILTILDEDAKISRLALAHAANIRTDILKKLKARRPTPKDHFMVSTVILLYLCYPTACRTTFRLLSCIVIGKDYSSGSAVPLFYLAADPEERCYQGQHLMMAFALGLPQLLLYVLGMPLLALLALFRNRDRLENARTKYRWGILYVGLRQERYYWDVGIVAMRKAAVFSLTVVGSSDKALAFQTHLAMIVLLISLLAHLVGRPYQPEWWLLDVFEVSGLTVCWLLMWSGICFYLEGVSTTQQELVSVCLVLVNACYAACVGVILVKQKVKEQASWTVMVGRRLCCLVGNESLSECFKRVPAIDPASKYQSSMELLTRASRHMDKVPITWQANPSNQIDEMGHRGFEMKTSERGDKDSIDRSELPNGWYQSLDPVTKKSYYYTLRGNTQWEFPVQSPPNWRPDTGMPLEVREEIPVRPVSRSRLDSGTAHGTRQYVTHFRNETKGRGLSLML